MKKITFVVGAAVGFVLGSKTGTGPYEQLQAKVRQVAHRPDVQEAVDQVKSTAKEQIGSVATTVGAKLPGSGDGTEQSITPTTTGVPEQHYADPQDLQFSSAASEKEELLDESLARGESLETLEAREQELSDGGQLTVPESANQEQLADGSPDR